MLKLQIFKI